MKTFEEERYNHWTILWLKSMVKARETKGTESDVHQNTTARRNMYRVCWGALHAIKERLNGR